METIFLYARDACVDCLTLNGSVFFILYAAFTRPSLFQRYLALSPSMAWGDYSILTLEEQHADAYEELPIRLYLSVADMDYESYLTGWQLLTGVLETRDYKDFHFQSRIHAGHDHSTVVIPSALDGLAYLYRN